MHMRRPRRAFPAQVWKFPKGLSLRDLRALQERALQEQALQEAPPPPLPGSASEPPAPPPGAAVLAKRPSALKRAAGPSLALQQQARMAGSACLMSCSRCRVPSCIFLGCQAAEVV